MEPAWGTPVGRRGLVVVCDDTESIRRLLRINLELDGFEVIEACDGATVMDVLGRLRDQRSLPHAVVLDVEMSPQDGWWALAQIRACPRLASVPVVMATAAPVCEDRELMHDRGLDACVLKPFDPDQILALVDGFVREGRAFSPMVR